MKARLPLNILYKQEASRVANVELAGVQKAFGDVQVLRDIDLPEHFAVGADENGLPTTVTFVETLATAPCAKRCWWPMRA